MNANERFLQLRDLGIRKVGTWELSDKKSGSGIPYNIKYQLYEPVSNVVYFNVVNRELKYQGICIRLLERRLYEIVVATQDYCARKSYKENKRGTEQGDCALNHKLTQSGGAEIYIYEPPKRIVEELHLGILIRCNAPSIGVKNIEKELNKQWLPEWNGQT